jgi:HEAT repeat protein
MKFRLLVLLMASNVFAAKPWELLSQGAADENPTRRALAIAALGTVPTAQAERLVEAALKDKDSVVRLSAVSALAERKSRAAIPKLRATLDDDVAEVSFSAAKALWEMGDRSGKYVLKEVLAGERKQSAGFIKRQVQDAKLTMHSPKKLVWMGAKEGAGFLFGPLGYGLGMVEAMTKDTAASARALSATLLAQDRNSVEELEDALYDKSPLVRAAAAKALGGFNNRALIPTLEALLEDKHDAARYMAAASILRIGRGAVKL